MGDADDDCAVTLADHSYFEACITDSGPSVSPASQACIDVFDFDTDNNIDLNDFSRFCQVYPP